MPNKYYLRSDRKAVKPEIKEPKPERFGNWNRAVDNWEQHVKSLPALDVDPDYLKRLSPGWFEGQEGKQLIYFTVNDRHFKLEVDSYQARDRYLWITIDGIERSFSGLQYLGTVPESITFAYEDPTELFKEQSCALYETDSIF